MPVRWHLQTPYSLPNLDPFPDFRTGPAGPEHRFPGRPAGTGRRHVDAAGPDLDPARTVFSGGLHRQDGRRHLACNHLFHIALLGACVSPTRCLTLAGGTLAGARHSGRLVCGIANSHCLAVAPAGLSVRGVCGVLGHADVPESQTQTVALSARQGRHVRGRRRHRCVVRWWAPAVHWCGCPP